MIYVKNTPQNAGVAIYGDFMDFERLYDSLHNVVGDEDEFISYETARMRVLGVCYDAPHPPCGNLDIRKRRNQHTFRGKAARLHRKRKIPFNNRVTLSGHIIPQHKCQKKCQ
jgi:hypothetical protein